MKMKTALILASVMLACLGLLALIGCKSSIDEPETPKTIEYRGLINDNLYILRVKETVEEGSARTRGLYVPKVTDTYELFIVSAEEGSDEDEGSMRMLGAGVVEIIPSAGDGLILHITGSNGEDLYGVMVIALVEITNASGKSETVEVPILLSLIGMMESGNDTPSVIKFGTADTVQSAVPNDIVNIKIPPAPKPIQAVESVRLNKSSLNLTVGGSETLTAMIYPDNAAIKTVIWSSSNTAAATVINGVVTGISAGTATITVTTADGATTARSAITVRAISSDENAAPPAPAGDGPPATIAVTGVTLDKSAVTLTAGASETLTATVNPGNAANKAVTWNSNNTAVATVINGVVKGVSAGTAAITVTTQDGGKTATCTVTVTDSTPTPTKTLSSIVITKQPAKTVYKVDDALDLSGLVVTANYSDNTSAAVTTYTSNPANGATLSTDGTQTVTVSYIEGTVTQTISFTVTVTASSKPVVNLDVPTGLSIDTGTKTASWGAVANANGYTIKIENGTAETHDVTGTSYPLPSLGVGTHKISVKANGGNEDATNIYSDSAYCTQVTYTVNKTEVPLTVPSLTISGTTASWTTVANANGYTIKIGTTETPVTGTSYSLASLAAATYQISVRANGGNEDAANKYTDSAYSAAQAYIVKTVVNLDVPTGLSINTGTKTASWTGVTNANTSNGYTIKIGTAETNVPSGTSHSLASLGEGTYQISVRANAYENSTHIYNSSDYCTPVEYIVAPAATYTFTLTESGTNLTSKTIPNATYPVTTIPEFTVTVTNTGNQQTNLAISSSETWLTVPATIAGIAAGSTGTFIVKPASPVNVGDHTATVAVTNGSGPLAVTASFDVTFNVTIPASLPPANINTALQEAADNGYTGPVEIDGPSPNPGTNVTLNIPPGIELECNGASISGSLNSSAMLTVTGGGSLHLHNSTVTASSNQRPAISIGAGSSVFIYEGTTVSSSNSSNNGQMPGTINIAGSGQLTIYNGSVTNSATGGTTRAIYVQDAAGSVTIYGGTISGSNSTSAIRGPGGTWKPSFPSSLPSPGTDPSGDPIVVGSVSLTPNNYPSGPWN